MHRKDIQNGLAVDFEQLRMVILAFVGCLRRHQKAKCGLCRITCILNGLSRDKNIGKRFAGIIHFRFFQCFLDRFTGQYDAASRICHSLAGIVVTGSDIVILAVDENRFLQIVIVAITVGINAIAEIIVQT